MFRLKKSSSVVGSHSSPQEGKDTQGQKPAHYCTKKPATISQKKRLIRQDPTDPKQKAVKDYKEQVDRHTPTPSTGKLKSKRTNTTTTDITT